MRLVLLITLLLLGLAYAPQAQAQHHGGGGHGGNGGHGGSGDQFFLSLSFNNLLGGLGFGYAPSGYSGYGGYPSYTPAYRYGRYRPVCRPGYWHWGRWVPERCWDKWEPY